MVASAAKLSIRRWLLYGKLSRPAPAGAAIALSRIVLIRVYAAAACLVCMLIAAWIGAVASALTADHWRVFRNMAGATLLDASRQAGAYQAGLLPVLMIWAALLTVTPTGFTAAFRAAVVAGGALGYLRFSPPAMALTSKVTPAAHWLTRFDDYCDRDATLFFIASIVVAYVLISEAAGRFRRLDTRPSRASHDGLARRMCAALLALLILLLAGWAATVIRLGGAHLAGARGGSFQGRYLLVMALIAVLVVQVSAIGPWLTAAALLTSAYALAPMAFTMPAVLRYPVGSGLLTQIGDAWGADALWAALFLYVPASALGIYLVIRLLD